MIQALLGGCLCAPLLLQVGEADNKTADNNWKSSLMWKSAVQPCPKLQVTLVLCSPSPRACSSISKAWSYLPRVTKGQNNWAKIVLLMKDLKDSQTHFTWFIRYLGSESSWPAHTLSNLPIHSCYLLFQLYCWSPKWISFPPAGIAGYTIC